jgi:hypothetical protein
MIFLGLYTGIKLLILANMFWCPREESVLGKSLPLILSGAVDLGGWNVIFMETSLPLLMEQHLSCSTRVFHRIRLR